MTVVNMPGSVWDWAVWLADDHTPDDACPSNSDGHAQADRSDPNRFGTAPRGRRVLLNDADAADLAARVRDGDERAFRDVYLAFYRPLWEFAYSLTGTGAAAEDVVQDVFANWWEKRAAVNIVKGLDPYLYSSVRHRALNWRRTTKVRARDDVTATITANRAGLGQADSAPDEKAHTHEFERALANAIAALPDTRRTALILRVRHGLDYAAIGEVMTISPEAAMIHVSRARTTLRKVLQRFYTD